MMKFVVVLALLLAAVSAKEYFKQPKYPCAYAVKITEYWKETKSGTIDVALNGRYFKYMIKSDEYSTTVLLRPDIQDKDGRMNTFYAYDQYCYSQFVDMEDVAYMLQTVGNPLISYVDGKSWDHKETKTYRGKKCDHYYDDNGEESIYVYDDRVYGYIDNSEEFVFEYEMEAPMEEFVLKEKDYPDCVKENKKVTEVPSEDYVFCAASSVKVAFVAIVVALVSSLF